VITTLRFTALPVYVRDSIFFRCSFRSFTPRCCRLIDVCLRYRSWRYVVLLRCCSVTRYVRTHCTTTHRYRTTVPRLPRTTVEHLLHLDFTLPVARLTAEHSTYTRYLTAGPPHWFTVATLRLPFAWTCYVVPPAAPFLPYVLLTRFGCVYTRLVTLPRSTHLFALLRSLRCALFDACCRARCSFSLQRLRSLVGFCCVVPLTRLPSEPVMMRLILPVLVADFGVRCHTC